MVFITLVCVWGLFKSYTSKHYEKQIEILERDTLPFVYTRLHGCYIPDDERHKSMRVLAHNIRHCAAVSTAGMTSVATHELLGLALLAALAR